MTACLTRVAGRGRTAACNKVQGRATGVCVTTGGLGPGVNHSYHAAPAIRVSTVDIARHHGLCHSASANRAIPVTSASSATTLVPFLRVPTVPRVGTLRLASRVNVRRVWPAPPVKKTPPTSVTPTRVSTVEHA
jgi:hypothetical protein